MAIFKNNLEKSIFETIVYFDIFDYPLTLVEIWKWLFKTSDFRFQVSELNFQSSIGNQRVGLREIQKVLDTSGVLKSLISTYQGFYFLKRRENLVKIRQERYNLAEKKFKKVLKVNRFLKFIPDIKMIAVCNDLAWSNAPEGSDIDLFVVTTPHKIWSVRFWTAGFLKIFGLRPSPKKTQDKICLSFFVDENHLNLEHLSLKLSSSSTPSTLSTPPSPSLPDIYLIYWITQLAPIYDAGGVYQKFLTANAWVKNYLPNFFEPAPSERRQLDRATLPAWLGVGEKFFRWLQLLIMPAKLKTMANQDTRVVVSDGVLKFHENDRREEHRNKWLQLISKLKNKE